MTDQTDAAQFLTIQRRPGWSSPSALVCSRWPDKLRGQHGLHRNRCQGSGAAGPRQPAAWSPTPDPQLPDLLEQARARRPRWATRTGRPDSACPEGLPRPELSDEGPQAALQLSGLTPAPGSSPLWILSSPLWMLSSLLLLLHLLAQR